MKYYILERSSSHLEDGCLGIQWLSHNSIIKPLSDTFICFQPHINIMAFINKKTPQPKLAISPAYS
jgi:hypothetical protein